MEGIYAYLAGARELYVNVYIGLLRYVAPGLAFILLWRCLKPLMFFKREPEIWAWLYLEDGTKYALTHWENVLGRSKSSDVRIDFPLQSSCRRHNGSGPRGFSKYRADRSPDRSGDAAR